MSEDLAAVRDSYDRVADNYVRLVADTAYGDIRRQPWLRGMIDGFAASVRGLGPVLDIGCGPGGLTAYLDGLGVPVSGVDLSPRMIEHARARYPQCRFEVASATELDLAPRSLGGILGWWSLFNLPRTVLPGVIARFAQALVRGGQLIVATHVGDDDVARTEGYGGVPVTWTTYQWQPETLADLMRSAGLRVVAELRVPPDPPIGAGVVLVGQRCNDEGDSH